MMDYSFIDEARPVEVHAIEGGQHSDVITPPPTALREDELSVGGIAPDEIQYNQDQLEALRQFVPFAREAYEQRGLVYPFSLSAPQDSLEVFPGMERLAIASAELSGMVSIGGGKAKEFETRALKALHKLLGGWAACVGHPRETPGGPELAIRQLRRLLKKHELGDMWPDFAKSGDHRSDGFVILGRVWGGPVVYLQCKNGPFDPRKYPTEFGALGLVMRDWFGWPSICRTMIPVYAVNSVLRLQDKAADFRDRHLAAVHILDAVDILAAEQGSTRHTLRQSRCHVF